MDEDFNGNKKPVPQIKQDPNVTQAIKNFKEDEKNNICADCLKPGTTHASVTFGVFLCGECADKHLEKLGVHKSLIKHLEADNFDEFQLKCLHWEFRGGNRKWWNLCKFEKMHKKDWQARYCSYVGRFRTKVLFLGASGQKTQDELKDMLADEERDAAETAIHYALIVDRLAYKCGIDSEKIDEGMQKHGRHLGDRFIEYGHLSEEAFAKLQQKLEEEKVNEKMQRAGRKTGDKMVVAGKASVEASVKAAEKAKKFSDEHQVPEKADRAGRKTGNAFVCMGKKATAAFNSGKAKAGKYFCILFRAEGPGLQRGPSCQREGEAVCCSRVGDQGGGQGRYQGGSHHPSCAQVI